MTCGRCRERRAEAGYTLRAVGGRVVQVCEVCWCLGVTAYYQRPRHVDKRGEYVPEPKRGRGR